MSPRNGNTLIAVVLVVLLMAGSVGMFFMIQVLSSANPDPHEASYDYYFEGTLNGIPCTGTGTSTYTPESPSKGYQYTIEYNLVSEETTTDTMSFFLLFGLDDKLVPEIYGEPIGKEIVGGFETDVYEFSSQDIHYTFYTGGTSILYQVIIDAPDYSVTGYILLT